MHYIFLGPINIDSKLPVDFYSLTHICTLSVSQAYSSDDFRISGTLLKDYSAVPILHNITVSTVFIPSRFTY
jgi:hypothetical protein